MKAIYTLTVGFCVLFLLGALAACDEAAENSATAQDIEAVARTVPQSDEPLARYDRGKLTLAVSTDEARGVVMETARKLIDDVREVTFEDPVLEMIDDRPYLLMRGKRPDGNCALAYVRLVSEEALASGTRLSVSEARVSQEENVELYGPPGGGSCHGDPCNSCLLVTSGGAEACSCIGTGPDGERGWCNHSTDG